MRKYLLILLVLFLYSCSSTSNKSKSTPLYEILTQQSDGGASIRFFEILTEAKEIKMLENDENLKRKMKTNDINTCNFVILNMGEQNTGGYRIGIESVIETESHIIIRVKDEVPKPNEMNTQAFSNPYSVVRIHSKKEIIFK
jgi:hypothetical protein